MSRLSSLLLALFHYNVHIDAGYHIKATCEYGLCLVLYGSNYTDGSNFPDTRRACEGLNQTVAAITDASVQDTAQRLLSGVPDIDDVWTAAYRRRNDWEYINGSEFDERPSITGESDGYCAFMRIRDYEDTSFVGDQCNENRGNAYPFCQLTRTKLGSCSTEAYTGFVYKDTCYYVHNQQPGYGGWYDAQTFCHTQLGGDLAYRHILDTDLVGQLGVSIDLWVGVTRYRWAWFPKTGVLFPMQYFKWGSGIDESRTNGRVAISSGDFTWKNIAATTRLKHFMCAYVDETATTTVATTRTHTSGETYTITDSGSADIATARGQNDSSKQFPVAAVVASAVVVVLLVTVLVLIFTLRKKRGCINSEPPENAQKVEARTPEESNTFTSSENQRNVSTESTNVIEYEDVTELTQTSHRDQDGRQSFPSADSYAAVNGQDQGRLTPNHKVYEAVTERDVLQTTSDSPYEAITERDERQTPSDSPYDVLTEPSQGKTTAADITYEDVNGLGAVQVTPSDNPYEVPSNYINIVDQPRVYDSLHK